MKPFPLIPDWVPDQIRKLQKCCVNTEAFFQNESNIIIWENSPQQSPLVFGNTVLKAFQTIKYHQAVQITVF